jgi:hypothetical protein
MFISLMVRNVAATQSGGSDSASFIRLQSKYQMGLSHLKAQVGKDALPSSLIWLLQVSEALFLRSFMWLLASINSSLCRPLPQNYITTWQLATGFMQKKRERAPKVEDTAFHNLISDVTSFTSVLFCSLETLVSKSMIKG